MKTCLLGLSLSLLPMLAFGQASVGGQDQTIYVDSTNGNSNGARGTKWPFPDLASALAVAHPRDQIIMRPGQYSCASTTTVNVDHIIIHANGATLVAASSSVLPLLDITATDVTIDDLEVYGARNSSDDDVDNGLIAVEAARCIINRCSLHDSKGHGVRMVQSWDGSTVSYCTIKNCSAGIAITNYNYADLTGVDLIYNKLIDNRSGGVRSTNQLNGAYAFYNEKIIGNTVTANNVNSLGIELAGGGIAGLPKIPHQHAIISHNYVSGYRFGISLNACGYCEASENQVISGTLCGIEFANTLNCLGAENVITEHCIKKL